MGCTALYLRTATISDTGIKSQRAILDKWCEDNGITNIELFIDNGYSGLEYDRPNFLKLLTNIENGKVSTVITTDVSRIGRDFVAINEYLKLLSTKVRYVAVNDGVDFNLQSSIIEALSKMTVKSGKRLKNG